MKCQKRETHDSERGRIIRIQMNSSSVLNYSLNLFKPITDPIIQFGISHNIPSSTISFISILCSFLLFILSRMCFDEKIFTYFLVSFLASSLEQNALARQNKNKWSDTNFRRAKEAQLKSLKAKRAGRMREIREEPVVKEKPKSTIEGLDINFDSVFSEEASVNAVTEKIQAVDLNAKEIESPTNLVESETGEALKGFSS